MPPDLPHRAVGCAKRIGFDAPRGRSLSYLVIVLLILLVGFLVVGLPAEPARADGVTSISAGYDHTCAVTVAGGVKCWGANDFGQLGNGSTSPSTTPVDVCADAACSEPLAGIDAISAGIFHTCALTAAGGVKCWGGNSEGALGDGTTEQRTTPVDVSGLTSGVSLVSAGDLSTCARTQAAGVKCWGWNAIGQLGDGSTTDRTVPVDVCADQTCAGPLTDIASVSFWGFKACALTTTAHVKCWGFNSFGELGDGTLTSRSTPVDVCADTNCDIPLADIAQVTAGDATTCAMTDAGGVKCWGTSPRTGDGEVCDTDGDNRCAFPSDVCSDATCDEPLGGVVAISSTGDHTCTRMVGGNLKCWGRNEEGQLGDGTNTHGLTPVDVCAGASCLTDLSGAVAVEGGQSHTCVLMSGGGVKCWGLNPDGRLGDGTTDDSNTPVDVVGLGVIGKPTQTPETDETATPTPSTTATATETPSATSSFTPTSSATPTTTPTPTDDQPVVEIFIDEAIGIADVLELKEGIVLIDLLEGVGIADVVLLREGIVPISVAERLGVTDTPGMLKTVLLKLNEAVGVHDSPAFEVNGCSGDVNGDGTANIFDLVAVARSMGSTPDSRRWNPDADLNGDAIVNVKDLQAVILSFGEPSCT